jgi:hypothetical protein
VSRALVHARRVLAEFDKAWGFARAATLGAALQVRARARPCTVLSLFVRARARCVIA